MRIQDAQSQLDSINAKMGWKYELGNPIIVGEIALNTTSLNSFTIVNEDKTKSIWVGSNGLLTDPALRELPDYLQERIEAYSENDDFRDNLQKMLEMFSEISEDYWDKK